MNTPKVAIVYLSYNSQPYLKGVISSIEQLNYPKESLHLIIVDNDSKDESVDIIQKEVLPKSEISMPKITFFPEMFNHGFAGGNNLGINHALLDGIDYVYLLNNDAKFHPDAIMEAVELAETDKKIGSVQSLMLLWQDENVVNSTGGMVHFLGFGFVRDNGKQINDEEIRFVVPVSGSEIAYSSGAAVLYKADLLREIGLLDAFLFLYHEDLQLGWRIRLTGSRNVVSTKSIVYHHYEFKRSIKKFFWMERNRLLVHLTYLDWRTLLLLAPFLFVLEIALIFFSIKAGWIKEKFFVYLDLFHPNTLKYIWKTRKKIKQLRAVPDREIVRLFTSKVEHQETDNIVVDRFANPVLTVVWSLLIKIIRW